MMRKAIPTLALLMILGLILIQMGCSKKDDPVTPPPPCSITLDQFNDWDSFYTGEDINIRWAKNTGGNVKIELFKGVDLAGTISASASNGGFFPWVNCSTFGQESGEDYSIQVTHLTSGSCEDRTNAFEMIDISNCYIQFPWTSKDTIVAQTAGDVFEVVWDSDHTSGELDLELWYEPFQALGEFVGLIESNIPDTGSYSWTVDTFHRGTDGGYRFRIRDAAVGAHRCADRSVPFYITDEDNCSIDVLGISGGGVYTLGQVLPISFSFENMSGVVDLRLYTGNQLVPGGSITSNFDTQLGSVSYMWTVDYYQHNEPVFDRFNVRAFDSNDEYCVGVSGNFTIPQ